MAMSKSSQKQGSGFNAGAPLRTRTPSQALRPVAAAVALLVTAAATAGPGQVDLGGGVMSPTYYANSPSGVWASGSNTGTALRKFVDKLPVPGTAASANNLGQYIPVAVAEKWVTPQGTLTNDDYYELAMVEFSERVHSDLKGATLLRGYVQIATAQWLVANPGKGVALFYPGTRNADGTFVPGAPIILPDTGAQAIAVEAPHALGPAILATSGVAVRLKVRNLLPFGRATKDAAGNVIARNGDLFLPVDKTIIGSGVAADGVTYYTENRASVHLHGGDSPWISDGTPYQWFAPAAEAVTISAEQAAMAAAATAANRPVPAFTPVSEFLRGPSAKNVPDMPDPGPGAMTFYYPNRQTARQMWYHDHTVGLTRVNVYAGLAAPYMLTDAKEQAMKAAGALPADEIPMVFQDKTFVPDDIGLQDRNWNTTAWGKPGDMWFPHVYESNGVTNLLNNGFTAAATAINDPTGVLLGANPTGRWDFGPELGEGPTVVPPLMTGEYGPPVVGADGMIRSPSTTPEAFMDTPLVNGTAYPSLSVQPKAYRFRLLNATNDRFLNLGLYVATSDATSPVPDSEVGLVPVPDPLLVPVCDGPVDPVTGLAVTVANPDPANPVNCRPANWPTTDNFILPGGVPDPTTAGPKIVQIGNETGWLPNTRHIPSTPAAYAVAQNAGVNGVAGALNNVGTHGLYMSPAERSDIVIDFSQYAGKTLILYNDSPAPAPGFDDRYDYYTGGADLSGAGGAESTKPGYGPNMRTIMQIKVAATGAVTALDFAALDAAVSSAFATRGEAPIVVTSDALTALAGNRNVSSLPAEVVSLVGGNPTISINAVGIVDKAIVEEWDPNFGRLNAVFGIVTQNGPRGQTYADKPTEFMRDGETTLWRIAHTGVDTHPVHLHLVNVQIVARVNADGTVEGPDPEELGWKETIKMNPAQDIIVAFRPKKPELAGFTVPSSIRLLDPTQPVGSPHGFTQIDPVSGLPATTQVVNAVADLGWEYTWHCHILGHEENDFMRVVSFIPNETAPNAPTLSATAAAQDLPVQIVFTDNAHDEYGYAIERAAIDPATNLLGAYTTVATLPAVTGPIAAVPATASTAAIAGLAAQSVTWSDTGAVADTQYRYRISALGSATQFDVGGLSTGLLPVSTTATVDISTALATPAAPTSSNLSARGVTLTLQAVGNAKSYRVEQLVNGTWVAPAAPVVVALNGITALISGLSPVTAYSFRALALNNSTASTPSAQVDVTTTPELLAAALNAPTTAVVNGAPQVTLSWADQSTGETSYQVARAATAAGPFTVLTGTLPADTMSYTDTTAVAGASYVYQVTALDGATAGPAATSTAVITATVPVAPATAPTATLVTASSLTLTFPAGANATSYKVEQSVDGGLNWLPTTAVVTLPVAPAITVTAAVTGVLPATSYLFRVSSVNAFATSAPTTSATPVRTLASLLAPTFGVPTSAVTDPATGAASVTLNWTNTSTGQTAYKVERFAGTLANSTRAGAVWAVLNAAYAAPGAAATLMNYSDTTAAAGTAYVYRLTAMDQVPAVATLGLAASQAVTSAIGVAAPLLNSATSAGATVTLSFTDKSTNETSFVVERALVTAGTPGVYAAVGLPVARTAALGTATGGAVPFVDATSLVGNVYAYRVKALNTVGAAPNLTISASLPSNELQVAVDLATPSGLSATAAIATATTTPVTLSFTDVSVGETGFEVHRSVDAGATYTLLATTPARTAAQATGVNTAVTFSDATAVPGQTYFYKVRAVQAAVAPAVAPVSQFSAPVSLTLAVGAPSSLSVALGTATATTQALMLSWVDNANNETRYVIERAPVDTTVTPNLVGAFAALPSTVARTGTAMTGMASAVSFTDATALLNTPYAYRVIAQRVGTAVAPAVAPVYSSLPSNEVVTSTAMAAGAPTTLSANAANGTSVLLSWIDNSTTETSFTIERAQVTIDAAGVKTLVAPFAAVGVTPTRTAAQRPGRGTAVSFTDLTATIGRTYDYRVVAVIPAPGVNLTSSAVTATLALNAPGNVTVLQVATGLQVGWTDNSNNETSFEIVRTDPAGVQRVTAVASTAAQRTAVGGAPLTFIDTTAVAGVTYSYVVRAVNLTGNVTVKSADSTPIVIASRSVADPSAPVAAITTARSITVTWSDLSTTETGFLVERAFAPTGGVAGAFAPLATVARTAAQTSQTNVPVSFVDTLALARALAAQGTYQYRVTAVNQTGVVTNASSQPVAGNVLNFSAPTAPTNLVQVLPMAPAVATPGTVVLSWVDPATTETGFSVQYVAVAAGVTVDPFAAAVLPAGTVTRNIAGANPSPTGGITLTGLVTGTRYFVRVAATNLVGASVYTAAVAVVAP
jgi:FtsP/CotA-like multicopper oxidase with cupredoxin domain/fibronectin type 3 domain-containing protein